MKHLGITTVRDGNPRTNSFHQKLEGYCNVQQYYLVSQYFFAENILPRNISARFLP